MEHLEIYNAAASVPKEACRRIEAGKLKNKTDINPMWRIKKLTELFGPCGTGWRTEVQQFWLEKGPKEQVSAFCSLHLYVRIGETWSEGIVGIGGNVFIQQTKDGLSMNDDCFKMAYTDALGVACKQLGFGADVYWEEDRGKYVETDKKGVSALQDEWERLGYNKEEIEEYCVGRFGCGVDKLTDEQKKSLRGLFKKISANYADG